MGNVKQPTTLLFACAMLATAPDAAIAGACQFEPLGEGRVADIVDGRSLRLDDGREVRLD